MNAKLSPACDDKVEYSQNEGADVPHNDIPPIDGLGLVQEANDSSRITEEGGERLNFDRNAEDEGVDSGMPPLGEAALDNTTTVQTTATTTSNPNIDLIMFFSCLNLSR